MISVVYGASGSGKTKRIIEAANVAADSASGHVVFITDNNASLGISPAVRFINLREYNVNTEEKFIGFIKGVIATNFDIQQVYIDGLGRLLNKTTEELENVFNTIAESDGDIKFVVTVAADKLPEYLKKYAK